MKKEIIIFCRKGISRYKLTNVQELLKQSFWSVSGSVASRGLMLLSSIFLARILGQVEYGELSIVRSTMNMFVIFAGFGIGSTTSRYIALNRDSNLREARRIYDVSLIFNFIIAIILAIGVFSFAEFLALASFNDASLMDEIKISSFLLFFATINGTYTGSLAGFQDFKAIAKATFFSSVLQAIFVVVGGWYFGVPGSLIGYGIGFVFLCFFLRRSIKRNFGKSKREIGLKKFGATDKSFLWRFSLPIAFSSFMVSPVFWWCKSFMIRESNFKEMAMFDVADQWRMIILFVPSALVQIALPALSNNQNNFKKTLSFNFKINIGVTLVLLIPLLIFAKTILSFYGEEYVNVGLFIVLLSTALFSSFCAVIGSAIASLGIVWEGFIFNLFWAIYLIAFTIYFINKGMGALGLAYAVLFSYLIHAISQFIFLRLRLTKLNIS